MARKQIRSDSGTTAVKRSSKAKAKLPIVESTVRKIVHKNKPVALHDVGPTLADRIGKQREQLFRAISLVECCKYASATLLEVESSEYIVGVYELLYDLLDSSAGELGSIAEDCCG